MGRKRKYATLEELYSDKNRRRRERYAAAKKQKENDPFNTTYTIAVKALRMMDNLAETSTSSMKRMRINKHNDGTSFTNMSTDETIENPLSSSPLMNKYGSLGSPTIQIDEALTSINIHGKSIANVNSIPIVPQDNASDCNTLSTKKAAPWRKTSSSINSSSSKDNDVKVSFDGQRRRKYATPEEAQRERNRRRHERYAIAKKTKQKSSVDNIFTFPLITPELQEDIRTNANFENNNHMLFNDESVCHVRSCFQGPELSEGNTNDSRIENTISMIRTYDSTKNSTTNEHDQLKFPIPESFLGPNFRDASSSTRNTPCRRRSTKHDPLQNIAVEPDVLPSILNCKYCDAKRFHKVPPGFCCSSGEIQLL
ncbi:unnamed protein product [Coffea canephora]|uniref:Uncharacterized protein n=1 Tax=Coffea canephora TaxID=49390 RepID=A0A068UG31_COFCA|nr:unnamed protein product [Coffea canephora]